MCQEKSKQGEGEAALKTEGDMDTRKKEDTLKSCSLQNIPYISVQAGESPENESLPRVENDKLKTIAMSAKDDDDKDVIKPARSRISNSGRIKGDTNPPSENGFRSGKSHGLSGVNMVISDGRIPPVGHKTSSGILIVDNHMPNISNLSIDNYIHNNSEATHYKCTPGNPENIDGAINDHGVAGNERFNAAMIPHGSSQMADHFFYSNQQPHQGPLAYGYAPFPTIAVQVPELPQYDPSCYSQPAVQQQSLNGTSGIIAPMQGMSNSVVQGSFAYTVPLVYSYPVWNEIESKERKHHDVALKRTGRKHDNGDDGVQKGNRKLRSGTEVTERADKSSKPKTFSRFFGDEVDANFFAAQKEAVRMSRIHVASSKSELLASYKRTVSVDDGRYNADVPKPASTSFNKFKKSQKISQIDSSDNWRSDLDMSQSTGRSTSQESITFEEMINNFAAFAQDQYGVLALQEIIDNCSPEQYSIVLDELTPDLETLCIDPYGNYIIQALLKASSSEESKCYIMDIAISGRVLALSLHVYGCRVIQTALEVFPLKEKLKIANEVVSNTLGCGADRHANHVIQKCIETIQPTHDAALNMCEIISKRALELSRDEYGCRLVQRLLEYCSIPTLVNSVIDKVLNCPLDFAMDHYGNYVVQHLIESSPEIRKAVVRALAPHALKLSCGQFACHVMELCLKKCPEDEISILLRSLLYENSSGNDTDSHLKPDDGNYESIIAPEACASILHMACNRYGNYVLQTALKLISSPEKNKIVNILEKHCNTLRRDTYGKHVLYLLGGLDCQS